MTGGGAVGLALSPLRSAVRRCSGESLHALDRPRDDGLEVVGDHRSLVHEGDSEQDRSLLHHDEVEEEGVVLGPQLQGAALRPFRSGHDGKGIGSSDRDTGRVAQ